MAAVALNTVRIDDPPRRGMSFPRSLPQLLTFSGQVEFPPSYSTVNLPLSLSLPPGAAPAVASSSPTSSIVPSDEKSALTSTLAEADTKFTDLTRTESEVDPGSYIRDPSKLVAYLIPFPEPAYAADGVHPIRFLIYTPPPPPLAKPAPGEKEPLVKKMQRKWQKQLREAKTSDAKAYTFKGIKGKVVKGHSWAFDKVTSADLAFVNRIPVSNDKGKKPSPPTSPLAEGDDEVEPDEETKKALKLEEMVLVYPPSIGLDESELRTEFVNSLMRTRSKAQRDVAISTGLLPFSIATDLVLAHVGGPGAFSQINGGWAALSIRGASNARNITKRLALSTESTDPSSSLDSLKLVFHASARVDTMRDYLAGKCIDRNEKLWPSHGQEVDEDAVLEAIGWQPSAGVLGVSTEGEETREEDEAYERLMVEQDLDEVMKKAAKTWEGWCKLHAKHPKRASKQ